MKPVNKKSYSPPGRSRRWGITLAFLFVFCTVVVALYRIPGVAAKETGTSNSGHLIADQSIKKVDFPSQKITRGQPFTFVLTLTGAVSAPVKFSLEMRPIRKSGGLGPNVLAPANRQVAAETTQHRFSIDTNPKLPVGLYQIALIQSGKVKYLTTRRVTSGESSESTTNGPPKTTRDKAANDKPSVKTATVYTPVTKVIYENPDAEPSAEVISEEPEDETTNPKVRVASTLQSLTPGQEFDLTPITKRKVRDTDYPDDRQVEITLRVEGSMTVLFTQYRDINKGKTVHVWKPFYATKNGKANGTPLTTGNYVIKLVRTVDPNPLMVVRIRFSVL